MADEGLEYLVFDPNKCTYCTEEINGVRIQCHECHEFILCLECFRYGAEIGKHKNTHKYKFVCDTYTTMLFPDSNWSIGDEARLLKNMEILGYGNWSHISELMHRTPEAVRAHYDKNYLTGLIGENTWNKVERATIDQEIDILLPVATTVEEKAFNRMPPLDIKADEAHHLGFISRRGDFEREYSTDVEAEQVISMLDDIVLDDSELDKAIKLAGVDLYLRRLRERVRKKCLVREYQLVAKFYAWHRKEQLKNFHKEERELRERLSVFSQFQPAYVHKCLVNGLEQEQDLKFRLSVLARYREAGLERLDECAHYEQHFAFSKKAANGNGGVALTPALHWRKKSEWLKSMLATETPPQDSKVDSTKKKKKRKKLKFSRTKVHAPHRRFLYKRKRKPATSADDDDDENSGVDVLNSSTRSSKSNK